MQSTVPERPQTPTLTLAHVRALHVEWERPDDDGGREITDYYVQYTRVGSDGWTEARFFFQHLGACRRRTPRAHVGLSMRRAASRPETFPTPPSDSVVAPRPLAVGVPGKDVSK